MKILIVDDSATVRKIVVRLLTQAGYTDFVEAADGVEALTKFNDGPIDVMLTDWNMPNMDGLALVTEVRKTNQETKIIMVTTEAEKQRVMTALQAGANSYVIKPFTSDVLLQRMDQVLGAATT